MGLYRGRVDHGSMSPAISQGSSIPRASAEPEVEEQEVASRERSEGENFGRFVSLNKGTVIPTPIYYNPHHKDLQNGKSNLGKPQFFHCPLHP